MAGYIGSKASVVSSGAERKKTFAITTTTTVLSGLSYTPQQVHVFHNGVRLVDGTDFTATDGASLTLTSAAQSGDEVVVISYASFQVADAYTKAEADSAFVSDPNGVVTVDGNGNVGIGTVSPTGLLTLDGGGDTYLALTHSTAMAGGIAVQNRSSGLEGVIAYNSTPSASRWEFILNGQERMRIDAAGRVTTPSQPAFFAGGNSGWVTTTSGGIVPLGVDAVNIGNGYNISSYAYTAPVSGSYYVSLHAYLDTTSQLVLKKNGSDFVAQGADTGFILYTNGNSTASTSGVIYLNAGDYIQMGARLNQSAYVYTGHSHFSGYLIG